MPHKQQLHEILYRFYSVLSLVEVSENNHHEWIYQKRPLDDRIHIVVLRNPYPCGIVCTFCKLILIMIVIDVDSLALD